MSGMIEVDELQYRTLVETRAGFIEDCDSLKARLAEQERIAEGLAAAIEAAKDRVREVSYPIHRTLGRHTGAFTHCQDGACRGLLAVLVALNGDDEALRAWEARHG